jgi:AbiV family abortive infection protein
MVVEPSLENVKAGIDASLSYGLRMIADARLLENNNSHLSAIPLYILAYEELGKSMYLISKYTRKIKVTEADWRKYTASPYAHYKKILVQYTHAINLLSRHTSGQVEEARMWEKQHGVYFPVPPRELMIAKYKRSRDIIKKLPIVKLACYYIDYHDGSWLSLHNYSRALLSSVCSYLYHETMIFYRVSRVELLKHSLNMKKMSKMKEDVVQATLKRYIAHEDFVELNNLRNAIHQPSFVQSREHAFAVIETIADDYQHLTKRGSSTEF